jgi:hypothetical protein
MAPTLDPRFLSEKRLFSIESIANGYARTSRSRALTELRPECVGADQQMRVAPDTPPG